jgi:selenocysteine lyase/cysteine desulfurase
VTALPREQFPVVGHHCYLDHAGIAPITLAAADALRWWADHYEHHGRTDYDEIEAGMGRTRIDAAAALGVDVDDVAFVKNTTEGLGFVSSGLSWQPGDRVVVPDLEFPSTVLPWLALRDAGVHIDLVTPAGDGRAISTEAFASVIGAGAPPKVVVTSWVNFGRGWRVDLAELAKVCHGAGSLLCVDLMQGLGVVPAQLAAWGVDFATAGPHKWLCAPRGVGLFYVAKSARERLRPLEPGWASVAHRGDWERLDLVWDDSARRFEGGSPNEAGILALGASLSVLLDAGIDRVWSYVNGLCDRLVERLEQVDTVRVLSDRSEGGRSAVVTFVLGGTDATEVAATLEREGFVCAARGGGIRVSPHGYIEESEVDAFADAVATIR